MSMVPGKLGFAFRFVFALAALCLGGRAAHAQGTPLPYWSWPIGFGGGLTTGHNSKNYRHNPGFHGSERGGLGLSMNGFSQDGAWGNIRPLSYEGVQFGYNFKGAPVTVYAG